LTLLTFIISIAARSWLSSFIEQRARVSSNIGITYSETDHKNGWNKRSLDAKILRKFSWINSLFIKM
jgi:hypothetical protein